MSDADQIALLKELIRDCWQMRLERGCPAAAASDLVRLEGQYREKLRELEAKRGVVA